MTSSHETTACALRRDATRSTPSSDLTRSTLDRRTQLDAVDAIARKAARDHPMLKEIQVNMGAMHQTMTATQKTAEMPEVKDIGDEHVGGGEDKALVPLKGTTGGGGELMTVKLDGGAEGA